MAMKSVPPPPAAYPHMRGGGSHDHHGGVYRHHRNTSPRHEHAGHCQETGGTPRHGQEIYRGRRHAQVFQTLS